MLFYFIFQMIIWLNICQSFKPSGPKWEKRRTKEAIYMEPIREKWDIFPLRKYGSATWTQNQRISLCQIRRQDSVISTNPYISFLIHLYFLNPLLH